MNDLRLGGEAREKMLSGMNVLADAVRVTLGPGGRFVALERGAGPPVIANSGVLVAREIELADPFENIGAALTREVAKRTSEAVGDGTTTATVLAQAMVNEGVKYVTAGLDAMGVKRGIDQAVAAAMAALKALARPCAGREEIAYVASISANNDRAIGELVAAAMTQVGRDGAVTVEDGTGLEDKLEFVQGMQFDRGYLSPYFITNPEKLASELDRPFILLCEQKASALMPLLPLLEQVAQTGRPLLVVADDVEGDALAALVVNNLQGTLRSCAVKAPSFGEQRRAWLADMAVITGATLVSDELGLALDQARLDQLGQADRVEIGRDQTVIIGGGGDAAAVAERLRQVRAMMEKTAPGYERDRLAERAARLAGGVAQLRIGAHSELELKEKKGRVEDALHAARAAVEEGIVPGGGVALMRARAAVSVLHGAGLAEDGGIHTVLRALEAPLRQIVTNGGQDPAEVIGRVAAGAGAYGYDAAGDAYGDLMALGIIDPLKVTRLALQNAASIAGLMLTTDCTIAHGQES